MNTPTRSERDGAVRIQVVAIGHRMPGWVESGWHEFARRMPRECALTLVELPPIRRGRGAGSARLVEDEGKRMLAAIPAGSHVVALEVEGGAWSTPQLSQRLDRWLHGGRDVALLIGGADGLAPDCRRAADERWSLSPLTFPHMLVRVIVAEQIYRAWSLLHNHPYHRE